MKSNTTGNRMALGIPWFRREDWEALLKAASDQDRLSATYEEWESKENARIHELTSRGVRVQKVVVDISELIQWCHEKDVHLDAGARARFVAEKIRKG